MFSTPTQVSFFQPIGPENIGCTYHNISSLHGGTKRCQYKNNAIKNKKQKTFSLRLIILDFVKIEGEPCDWPACFDSKGATVLPGEHRQQTFLMGTAAVVAGPGQQDDNATDRHTENNALLSCSPQSIPVFAAYVALETLQVN